MIFARATTLVALFLVTISCSCYYFALAFDNNNNNIQQDDRTTRAQVASAIDDVPDLYVKDDIITPIVGEKQFNELVLEPQNKTQRLKLTLVQFYMATCPDCQGFSPYFKRFVKSVCKNWLSSVRVFVVNCNNDENINLCWHQNPQLIVPLIRWYAFPEIYSLVDTAIKSNCSQIEQNFSQQILNISHRQFIFKQRRDLLSLRRSTLAFGSQLIESVKHLKGTEATNNKDDKCKNLSRQIETTVDEHLAPFWQTALEPLRQNSLVSQLELRRNACLIQARVETSDENAKIAHFVVFERNNSYVGSTLALDWADQACRSVLVHYSNDPKLFDDVRTDKIQGPAIYFLGARELAFKFNKVPKFDLLINNATSLRRNKSKGRNNSSPLHSNNKRRKAKNNNNNTILATDDWKDIENVNWAPERIYGFEETLRSVFSEKIAQVSRQVTHISSNSKIPNSTLIEYGFIKTVAQTSLVVKPADEDKSRLTLTDYYKAVEAIVDHELTVRFELDGHRLVAAICLIRHLSQMFPFQPRNDSKSRDYLKAVDTSLVEILAKNNFSTPVCKQNSPPLGSDQHEKLSTISVKSELLKKAQAQIRSQLKIGLPPGELLKFTYCSSSKPHLRGHTCGLWIVFHTLTVAQFEKSGAKVQIDNLSKDLRKNLQQQTDLQNDQYAFQLKPYGKQQPHRCDYDSHQSKRPRNSRLVSYNCDPEQPESSFEKQTSDRRFVDAPNNVLASIINYSRFFQTCTNCASHFSCMVSLKPPMSVVQDSGQEPFGAERSLLWLWEAHNRVNLRTRGTHSEDPAHPKHVFPAYGACPLCYLEKPKTDFEPIDELKFNRTALTSFIVSRYRRQAILHNKQRIEDLFHPI